MTDEQAFLTGSDTGVTGSDAGLDLAKGLQVDMDAMVVDERHVTSWAAVCSRVVYLRRWPDLDTLPERLPVPQVLRVCALLSRRQTVAFRVAQLARLEPRACQDILIALCEHSCLQFMQVNSESPASQQAPSPAAEGMLRRLWRLMQADSAGKHVGELVGSKP